MPRFPRLRFVAIALFIVVAACGSSQDDAADSSTTTAAAPAVESTTSSSSSSTTAPPTSTTETTVGEPSRTVDLEDCGDAGEFDLLCEAYEILTAEYVDALDATVLADGAIEGIETVFADSSDPTDRLICAAPETAFEATCEVAAGAVAAGADVPSVVEAAIRGMFDFGLDDPNSSYLPPSALQRINEEQSGTVSGIGALVNSEEPDENGDPQPCSIISDTCRLSIVGLIEGGPAEAAGIQVGDVTVTVDGESVLGWATDEVVANVRGPEGTPVIVGMERDGQLIDFEIVRAAIVIPVTESEILDGGIGYVSLSQFTSNSDDLLREELAELVAAGVDSIILDLQNNPGGSLNATVSIASEFLDDGLVVRTESPDQDRTYELENGGVLIDQDIEIVVLVNRASASASEVLSALLQERDRATILGEATFGKNTVQQQFGLDNGGAVKVTIARWTTPDGNDFGVDGVIPDVAFDIPPGSGPDFLIDEAVAYLTTASG